MGFRLPKRKAATLTFDGTEWEGAEVRVLLSAPLEIILLVEEGGSRDGVTSSDVFEAVMEEIVISWNLEDDEGNPIPATLEGMGKVPQEFFGLLMRGYTQNLMSVPDPLDEPSPNGKQSPGDTMQELANSSESLQASNGPG